MSGKRLLERSLSNMTPAHNLKEQHGRARLLAGRAVPGGIDASSTGDAIRPARSRALPGAD